MQLDTEAGLKVSGQHHRSLGIHSRGACQTAADCLIYQFRIRSCLLGKGKSLAYGCNIYSNYNLVCQLCNVSGT